MKLVPQPRTARADRHPASGGFPWAGAYAGGMTATRLWIVTGAAGFVGNVLVRELVARGEAVRAVLRSGLRPRSLAGVDCERVAGDVLDPASLRAAFAAPEGVDAIVVHAAGAVAITERVPESVRAVNVDGTRNVVEACRAAGVARLVEVSSVHAIPEPADGGTIREADVIDADAVHGEYARTKAEATRLVLEADDLDRVVVHPSGVIGPGDYGDTHLTRLIRDAVAGRLPVVVAGGYDFVDVRDVAVGVIAAAERGRDGACYLLTGHYATAREVVHLAMRASRRRAWLPPILPFWIARIAAPLGEWVARRRGVVPLFTAYSLHTLRSNGDFDCSRAARELGWSPRPLARTVLETVDWLAEHPARR